MSIRGSLLSVNGFTLKKIMVILKVVGYKIENVILAKKDCSQCEEYETALLNIREDLVDQLNAYVVSCVSSMLAKLYNPAKEPSIVFFRHGVPLLYDGE